MLLLPHWNAQFEHTVQQTRQSQLNWSNFAASFCVWAVCGCALVFVYCCCSSLMDSPLSWKEMLHIMCLVIDILILKEGIRRKRSRGFTAQANCYKKRLQLGLVRVKKMRRKLEQKFHWIKDGPCLKLAVYKYIYSTHLILQWGCRGVCVCVSAGDFLILHNVTEKKCFMLSLLHIHIPAHTDSPSTSLQKHCSNSPWIAGLCCHPTTSPPGLHSATPQSSAGSVTMTPVMKTQATKASAHSGFIFCLLCEREEMVLALELP